MVIVTSLAPPRFVTYGGTGHSGGPVPETGDLVAHRSIVESIALGGDVDFRPRAQFVTSPGAWDGFSNSIAPQVQNALNLTLPLKSRAQMPDLLATIEHLQPRFTAAVLGLRSLHFARFLPTADFANLLVITAFDGDIESYLMDFIGTLGSEFDALLRFMQDPPRLPVQDYPDEFAKWVFEHNMSRVGVISAYPPLTVLDILHSAGMRGNTILHHKGPHLPDPDHAMPPGGQAQDGVPT